MSRRFQFMLSACSGLLCVSFLFCSALAKNRDELTNGDARIADWFKSAKAPNGGSCCDLADGHRTKYEMRDDHFWVPIDNMWVEVPTQAVIINAQNPTGEGVVWYTWSAYGIVQAPNRQPIITCFAPAAET